MVSETNQWWQDDREVAELIWCLAHVDRLVAPPLSQDIKAPEDIHHSDPESSTENPSDDYPKIPPSVKEKEEPQIPIAANLKQPDHAQTSPEKPESSSSNYSSPIRVPDPFPLPKPREISKALLPLSKRVPGLLANELDIEATVEQTAEADGLPMLAFRSPLERWFEVHLLIDCSPSMAFWGDLAEGVATLFRWQGFFRDVRIWHFDTTEPTPQLFSGVDRIERSVGSLIAPGGHRLFIALTDTLGKAWYSGQAFEVLAQLGEQHPVSIAHVFPQTLWQRTGLHQAIQRPLIASQPECANSMLKVGARLRTTARLYQFPIFNLSVNHFSTWANFTTGSGSNSIQGVLIRQHQPETDTTNPKSVAETPEQLLRGFLANASPKARKLAEVLAAVPLIPPVMRLAQQWFLPDSEHWHLAEVFFSGLLQKSSLGPEQATVPETWYEFRPGIRELLLGNSPVQRTTEIWREIGDFIEHRYGSLRDFPARIPNPAGSVPDVAADPDLYFAEVKAAVLTTWGGEYANLAQELSQKVAKRKREKDEIGKGTVDLTDNLEPFEFEAEVPTIVVEEELDEYEEKLQQWTFQTPTVNRRGEIIKTTTYTASYFTETLTDNVELEMVAIPGGTFTMGSPENEVRSQKSKLRSLRNNERPQHNVTIQPFFMGKYPVTQAQWKAIALMTDLKVERDLNPHPSRFTGEKRPVERINWYEAVEFCHRLSQLTGREYRLPSEAQWEYACRGVREPLKLDSGESYPPFYFGETITGKLANYDASRTYRDQPPGKESKETTPVGQFYPNPFGLYDMHGNVWEWCLDDWHDNYEGAPTDGSAWIDKNEPENVKTENKSNSDKNDENNPKSPLRGGSWIYNPNNCRSAVRLSINRRGLRVLNVGFRIVCVSGMKSEV
ncbi:formylglycine-generating enzyme family protein [Moorena sp. SIO4G3]|uniref:formylglycine-generating enzyme family protein n=1 Tax=Moorena sp. SIO4G3 TaxID=2607821 RepID=UPI001429CC32|nr:formylglycine-generating enzyme family protein [Moorena sp. SIO4G3]NEO77350.1 formylglycine-generating enzyme family protein [Moorena sp. SIO4G3]